VERLEDKVVIVAVVVTDADLAIAEQSALAPRTVRPNSCKDIGGSDCRKMFDSLERVK
jgi:hypothetical protein